MNNDNQPLVPPSSVTANLRGAHIQALASGDASHRLNRELVKHSRPWEGERYVSIRMKDLAEKFGSVTVELVNGNVLSLGVVGEEKDGLIQVKTIKGDSLELAVQSIVSITGQRQPGTPLL